MNTRKVLLLVLLTGFVGQKVSSFTAGDIATVKGGLSLLSGIAAGTIVGMTISSDLDKIRKELKEMERLKLESLLALKEKLHDNLSERERFEIEKNIYLYEKLSTFKKFIGAKDKEHRRLLLSVAIALLTTMLVFCLSYNCGEAILGEIADVAGRSARDEGGRVVHGAVRGAFGRVFG